MGLLDLFSKTPAPAAQVTLPSGSFTIDPTGRVVASTLPVGAPEALVRDIGQAVLATFTAATAAQLRLTEFTVHYATFRITAREMRGGAMIFLAPRALARK